MQVSKWGNSLAVRLPKALVRELKLKAGDEVNVIPTDQATLAVQRAATRAGIVETLRRFRRPLPAGYRFSRDQANTRDRRG